MLIEVSNTIRIKNPTDTVKQWCKDNLVISNPEYSKKLRMSLWLGNTPKTLSLYEIDGDTWVLPFGVLNEVFSMRDKSTIVFNGFNHNTDVVNYHEHGLNLFDYQEEAVNKMINAKFGILQSPAGSGKTQMGIALAFRLKRKTLWLCHTKDLINQSKERALQYISKDLIGTITEGKVNIGRGITFATIQTMCNLDLAQYKDTWDVIITDEVHRVSGTPTAVTRYQKVLNSLSARHKYGLSATVHRSDGMIKATYALVGKVAYNVPPEAVADKIENVGIKPIETSFDLQLSSLNPDGTLNYAKLINDICDDDVRNDLIVKSIINEGGNHSSLILSDRVHHLAKIISLLPKNIRDKSVVIHGKMTSKKGKHAREQALEDMRNGKKRYLFATYALAKEGLDIPRLDRLYLTTPRNDYAVIVQSVGRIARKFEGKDDPVAIDFVDSKVKYLAKSYKKRLRSYRKCNCYFVEGK